MSVGEAKPTFEATRVLSLDRWDRIVVQVPATVKSHHDFVKSIRKIRKKLVGSRGREPRKFPESIYYLLGFIVGDAIKHLGPEKRLTLSLSLQLTKKHPDNLQLGEYVMKCVRMLGIRALRGYDGQPRKKVPNGFYSWNTAYSGAIGWLFTACLGLRWNQKTTTDPVSMDWIFFAPRRYRLWFLRGLADSDGGVQFHHRWAEICSSPNTEFVRALFESLELRTQVRIHNGYGYVSMSAVDAARIQLFNPDIMTYRRRLLEKLVNARSYQRWPEWLEKRVSDMIHENIGSRDISERLLTEGVFVRPRTISRKRKLPFIFESDGRWPRPLSGQVEDGASAEIRSRDPRL